MEKITLSSKIQELEYAKKAVQSILDDGSCLVDFHGIEYWSGRVESLRELIKNSM